MTTKIVFAIVIAMTIPASAQGVFDRIKQSAKDKVQRIDTKTSDTMDKGMDTAEGGASSTAKPASKPAGNSAPTPDASAASGDTPQTTQSPAALVKVYQNYDFTPGDTILFADDFVSTQDGEFPEQWELVKGQAVVNKQQGYSSFLLTDGNYVQVSPRVKTKNYLGPQFTVEYDTFFLADSYPLMVFFDNGDESASLSIGADSADFSSSEVNLNGNLPVAIGSDNYKGHWHHIALAVKNHQLKVYVDQYRVLMVPDMHFTPLSLKMGGIGSQEAPLIFHTMRIASGGGMNMVGQKFTDAKIVTHGINFDIDKATLRPESMGTLNQIKRIMTDNPDLKFEIDGHTDNTGSSPHNLALSQQRADVVKAQLTAMGIDASRLTAKGYGDTKPMADNATAEGKANNRRVEFVKAG
ncbi:MAG: OmpA family protein [Acidobacteria bacterium]|nr:OmpA family protein [Acidobacteriota bacterium]